MAKHRFISLTYDLYVGDENEELMEQATKERPLTFISWIGMMLPKFEENVADLKVGDKFDFTIGQSAETASKLCWLVAALYMFSAVCQFVGVALVYNIDKKTLAQMTEELAARKAK